MKIYQFIYKTIKTCFRSQEDTSAVTGAVTGAVADLLHLNAVADDVSESESGTGA